MARLRAAIVRRINRILDESELSAQNFSASYPESGNLVEIAFIANDTYQLKINNAYGAFSLTAIPGTIMLSEDHTYDNFDDCIKAIRTWTANVASEVRASNPAFQEMDKFRTEFEEKLKGAQFNSADFFTQEEANH